MFLPVPVGFHKIVKIRLIYYCIICCKFFQRVFLSLNTDKGNSTIFSGKELTLCGRRNSDPITGSESNFLSVNNNFSLARKDTVNFFVCFMRMYERNISSCRKIIDAYFSTCERKGFVKFNSTLISNICFCIVCHGMYLHFS